MALVELSQHRTDFAKWLAAKVPITGEADKDIIHKVSTMEAHDRHFPTEKEIANKAKAGSPLMIDLSWQKNLKPIVKLLVDTYKSLHECGLDDALKKARKLAPMWGPCLKQMRSSRP